MIVILALVCVLAVVNAYLLREVKNLKKSVWAGEADNRRIWQTINRRLTGTVEKKDG